VALFFRGSWTIQSCCHLQVVSPKQALQLEVDIVPCHEDAISSILPGIQDDCQVTAERMT
jgi:hypothetical protein